MTLKEQLENGGFSKFGAALCVQEVKEWLEEQKSGIPGSQIDSLIDLLLERIDVSVQLDGEKK